jgi:hypothetical protein
MRKEIMSKVLKLFKVHPDKSVQPEYFRDKLAAKAKRDKLREDGFPKAAVLRGPDHYRGESFQEDITE